MHDILDEINNLYLQYSASEQFINSCREKGWWCRNVVSLKVRLTKKLISKKILRLVNNYNDVTPLNEKSNNIVVSLTSFPQRINTTHLAIESMFRQTMSPSKIILWLSEIEFPKLYEDIPDSLKILCDKGLQIIFVKDNLRSHMKYFYAIDSFPQNMIVTIDDDLYYPNYTIERLVELNKLFPNSVCANIVRKISIKNTEYETYRNWRKYHSDKIENRSHLNVSMGMGGVLYPPNIFDKKVNDAETIKKICLQADDLWLKANEIRCNTEVAIGRDVFSHPLIIPKTQRCGLQRVNMGHVNRNDIQWQALVQHFGIDVEKFCLLCRQNGEIE